MRRESPRTESWFIHSPDSEACSSSSCSCSSCSCSSACSSSSFCTSTAQAPLHPPWHALLPLQAFKGWDVALRALALLHAARPQLRVTWVCQAQPQLHGASFPVDFIVDPPQATLPDVYRLPHDLLLFASRFEARRVTPHRPVAPAPPLPMPHCPLLTS